MVYLRQCFNNLRFNQKSKKSRIIVDRSKKVVVNFRILGRRKDLRKYIIILKKEVCRESYERNSVIRLEQEWNEFRKTII